nr:hypothetical protein [Acidithiobacillus sp. 'AMD consortium']
MGQLFGPLVNGLATDPKRIANGFHSAAEDPYRFLFCSDGAHDE